MVTASLLSDMNSAREVNVYARIARGRGRERYVYLYLYVLLHISPLHDRNRAGEKFFDLNFSFSKLHLIQHFSFNRDCSRKLEALYFDLYVTQNIDIIFGHNFLLGEKN